MLHAEFQAVTRIFAEIMDEIIGMLIRARIEFISYFIDIFRYRWDFRL